MGTQHISDLLPAVMGNSELQPQGSKLSKNGDEIRLEIALQSPLIAKSPVEDLKQVLRVVMLKLGLRGANMPAGEEKSVLIFHIIENFGGHRVEEIKLAFDMAIMGKLEIDDVNCFENFSCQYFSKIMNAYRLWSKEAVKVVSMDMPPIQVILTDKQLEDLMRKDIEDKYQQMRRGRVPYGLPDGTKEILVKDGLMKPDEDLTSFFVQRLGKGIENIYVPVEI